MSSHTPERRPFAQEEPKSPSDAVPLRDDDTEQQDSGRGALFDSSFRERLRARRPLLPQEPKLEEEERKTS